MLAQGKPHCYRFRVPANQTVSINDCIRGKVSWNTDTLGDFVVMRSNGLPVYNFCVAVDDALMKISHVIRAEEHLPNTLRQVNSSFSTDMRHVVTASVHGKSNHSRLRCII